CRTALVAVSTRPGSPSFPARATNSTRSRAPGSATGSRSEHALTLAEAVRGALAASQFVVVVGGDCSILLGCLAGARLEGRCGLVHIDGHSDLRGVRWR